MKIKLKNIIIDTFTFLTHLVLSLFILGLGYISRNGIMRAPVDKEEVFIGNIAIILGIIFLAANIFMLVKRSVLSYAITVLIASISMIIWIVIEKSVDMNMILLLYLIVFIPLTIYKYKINKAKKV